MRAEEISSPTQIEGRSLFVIDIELWDAPTQLDRQIRVQRLVSHIEAAGGEIQSRYVGSAGLIVLRARLRGTVLRDILALSAVARIDLRPTPDLGERDAPVVPIEGIQPTPPAADAPLIGIIDSGSKSIRC